MKRLGLDIGGANLKCAWDDQRAQVLPFPLYREPNRLAHRLRELAGNEPFDELAVTMTGELCDCFATRSQGVSRILAAVAELARARPVRVWSTAEQFVTPEQAIAEPMRVASANWHALGSLIARQLNTRQRPVPCALLLDMGSTTTDIIPLAAGKVAARAFTDADRLATSELLYLGIARTPAFALGEAVMLAGRRTRLMAEPFADTADILLLSADTSEAPDDAATCDDRPRTRRAAANRILRMVGADLHTHQPDHAAHIARQLRRRMIERISRAIRHVTARTGAPAAIITSGSGEPFISRVAARTLPDVPIDPLSSQIGSNASAAACAYALTQLANPHPPRTAP